MRPNLSQIQNAMLLALGRKNPTTLDPFESFIREQIAGLSRGIDGLHGEVARLAEDLKAAETRLAETVGQYQGVAATLEAYYSAKMKAAGSPAPAQDPGAPAGTSGPEVPTPAAGGQDSEPRS